MEQFDTKFVQEFEDAHLQICQHL